MASKLPPSMRVYVARPRQPWSGLSMLHFSMIRFLSALLPKCELDVCHDEARWGAGYAQLFESPSSLPPTVALTRSCYNPSSRRSRGEHAECHPGFADHTPTR